MSDLKTQLCQMMYDWEDLGERAEIIADKWKNTIVEAVEKEWVKEWEKKYPDFTGYKNGFNDAKNLQYKPYDEDINALSWTIHFLKSRLWLFNKPNAELVNCLEHLLSELDRIRR